MQRSTTWIIKSLWGACERWSKSDCIDLSAAFAYYTLQSFFPILLISLSIASWFLGKQDGLDQQIISIAAQILPPSVVELVETTLFKLIDQGFGAGILGAMFLLFTAGNAYLSLQRGSDRLWEDELPSRRINSAWQEQASRFLRNRIEAFLVVFWLHFLALSLFLGSWITRDSYRYMIPKFLTGILLILTYFTGPVGLSIYWFVRIFFAKKISFND